MVFPACLSSVTFTQDESRWSRRKSPEDGSCLALQQRGTPEHLTPLPQPSVSSFVTWEGAAHLPGFFPGLPAAGLCRPAPVGVRSPWRARRSRWQHSMASRGHCRAAQTVLRRRNGPLRKATCSQGCMGTASSVHPPFRGVVQTPGPSGLTSLQVEGGRHPVSPPTAPQPLSTMPCLEALGVARVWSQSSLHHGAPLQLCQASGGGVPTWHPWHPQTCGSFHPWGTPLLRVKAERCSGQNHPLLSLREEGALSCESRRGHQSPHDQLLPSYSRGRVTGSSGSLHPPRPPGGSGSPQCCDSYLNNQHFSSHSGPGPLIALRPLKTKEMRQTLSLPQGNWGSGEIKGRAQDFMEPPCWD